MSETEELDFLFNLNANVLVAGGYCVRHHCIGLFSVSETPKLVPTSRPLHLLLLVKNGGPWDLLTLPISHLLGSDSHVHPLRRAFLCHPRQSIFAFFQIPTPLLYIFALYFNLFIPGIGA